MLEWIELHIADLWDFLTYLYAVHPWALIVMLFVIALTVYFVVLAVFTVIVGIPIAMPVGLIAGILTFVKLSHSDDWCAEEDDEEDLETYEEELKEESTAIEDQVIEDIQLPSWMVKKNGRLL